MSSYSKNLGGQDLNMNQYVPPQNVSGQYSASGNPNNVSQNVNENFQGSPGLSPEKLIKKFERDYQDIQRFNLDDINRELDNNMNEVIILLNRRKQLIVQKKKLLKEEYGMKSDQIKRMNPDDLAQEIMRSSLDDKSLQNIVVNNNNIPRMQKIVQSVTRDLNTNTQQRQKQEMSRSGDFWNTNKQYETEIDNLLKQLKYYDSELEGANKGIQDNCRDLDQIEDNIRDLLLTKNEDHVKQAEPYFQKKQKQLGSLKDQTGVRNKIKDEKINLIYRIIEKLQQLQNLRDGRLNDLSNVFGIDENAESNVKITYYMDFVDQLENLAKIKENMYDLEQQEEPLEVELDRALKDNDAIFQEMIRRQSDEARLFAEYAENQRKRIQMQRAVEYFINHANLNQLQHLDIKDILKKFKDNIIFLKPLVEEDVAIRMGLQKTGETIQTFQNILNANKLEKQRRKELVQHLEHCYKLKKEGEFKQESIKTMEIELSRKYQEKCHIDEEIETHIGDADLDQYKKFDQVLKQHDYEISQLKNQKAAVKKEVDDISVEVINQMGMIKTEYEDIIREVAPANLMNTYDFQKATDIKHVQNYLKKTFKRLGLHFEESVFQSKQSSQFISNQHH